MITADQLRKGGYVVSPDIVKGKVSHGKLTLNTEEVLTIIEKEIVDNYEANEAIIDFDFISSIRKYFEDNRIFNTEYDNIDKASFNTAVSDYIKTNVIEKLRENGYNVDIGLYGMSDNVITIASINTDLFGY